ncbi:MAG: 7-cyano-7-deazaguanine synthase QueC [bacterium]
MKKSEIRGTHEVGAKSIVLLSGGLDSAVNLAKAKEGTEVKLALTFDYGQRAAGQEIKAARRLCQFYKVTHQVIELPWLAEVTTTSLVDKSRDVPFPDLNRDDQAGLARAVWVPNRNGLFINIAASLAEALDCDLIVVGFNAEEAVTFPDNSVPFLEAVNLSLSYSTLSYPKVVGYTLRLDKPGIVSLGKELGVPLDRIWSCYLGETLMCGRCESCQRCIRAFKKAGAWDLIGEKFRR